MPLDLNTQLANNNSSTPANVAPPFTFEEDISSSDAIKVVLEDTDVPHGRPRELAGFQSGGKVDVAQGGIYNPGSDRVIMQMMAVRENNLVVHGAFRDRIRAGAQRQQGGPEPNHARKMRDLIELVKYRRNKLLITWAGDQRSGVLLETKFDEEGVHDIAYELTFLIASSTSGASGQGSSLSTTPTPSLEDLRSQMAASHAERIAELDALLVNAAVVATVSNGMSAVSSALDQMSIATTTIERVAVTTPQRLNQQVNAVVSSAQNVQTQVQNVATGNVVQNGQLTAGGGLNQVRYDQAMQQSTSDAAASWWQWQTTTSLTLDQMLDAMRQAKLQANQLVKDSTRLYRVQPGDTLESIALSQLGSKSRAPDLGITQDKLVPGRYVRIAARRGVNPRGGNT